MKDTLRVTYGLDQAGYKSPSITASGPEGGDSLGTEWVQLLSCQSWAGGGNPQALRVFR